jgi:hypothetical protein
MKKIVATLLLLSATSAFAGSYTAGAPSTTNNDDSCDVAVMPAATLLLPYFEVQIDQPQSTARTTLFTVVNTSQYPQIARITIWTDYAFPVLDFNLFLTGYDVQSINLYDLLGPRATIAPPSGTSSGAETGNRSQPNNANPNFAPSAVSACTLLPGAVPANLMEDVRNALTSGRYSLCGTTPVGSAKGTQLATGYATIDVVKTCGTSLPTESAYFDDLLYDNVLTGDYQSINPNPSTGNYAGGNPLVHIRAIPEGGPAGVITSTNLPATFYEHYTPAGAPKMDRRQPLPSAFAARFIEGGTGQFNTDLLIWREGVTGSGARCDEYAHNVMPFGEAVRFDEHENATGFCAIECPPSLARLNASSKTPTTSTAVFPPLLTSGGDVAGWMYLNLNNGSTRASQNWVVTSMSAEGRFQVVFDGLMLANGCTPAPKPSSANNPIGPGPNVTP